MSAGNAYAIGLDKNAANYTPLSPLSLLARSALPAPAAECVSRVVRRTRLWRLEKITVAEAYQAFLSILEANGLTVIPHGRFYKIIDSPDAKQGSPVYVAGQAGTGEERYITRIHRLSQPMGRASSFTADRRRVVKG